MQVKVLKRFFDMESDGKLRQPNEVLEVDEKRASALVVHKVADVIPEKKTVKKEAAE